MRISKNNFLVQVDSQFQKPNIPGFDFIDTDFNPKALATKIGRIYALPIYVGEEYKYDVKLKEGDLVVFNHIVCDDKNKIENNIFLCAYYNIYAKIDDGKIIPLEDTIFCEKIIDSGIEIGCFKVEGKVSDKYAKVFEVSAYMKKQGIQSGDIIFFTKNADYEIVVGGKELLKMHQRNIIGIERNGELVPFGRKLIVKNITKWNDAGGLKRMYASSNLQTGVVINGGITRIEKGKMLTYFALISSEVTWKGEKYSFIKDENIKFIIE